MVEWLVDEMVVEWLVDEMVVKVLVECFCGHVSAHMSTCACI